MLSDLQLVLMDISAEFVDCLPQRWDHIAQSLNVLGISLMLLVKRFEGLSESSELNTSIGYELKKIFQRGHRGCGKR